MTSAGNIGACAHPISTDTSITIYDQLHKIYLAAKNGSVQDASREFNRLPINIQAIIFKHSYPENSPSITDSQWIHMSGSLILLQTAIQQVAFNTFDSLHGYYKESIRCRVYHNSPIRRFNHDYEFDYVKHNVDSLLLTLSDSDLTPELMNTIDSWVEEASEVNGETTKRQIVDFLTDRTKTRLFFDNYQLSSLPKIFHTPAFTNRLRDLNLRNNCLNSLPEGLGNLIALEELRASNNNITIVPDEIGKLISLRILNMSGNKLTFISKEIKHLKSLKTFDISRNRTFSSPDFEICDLPRSCRVDISYTSLSREILTKIEQDRKSPGYLGPKTILYISFDMNKSIASHTTNYSESIESVDQLYHSIFNDATTNRKDFPKLFQNAEAKEQMRKWLHNLVVNNPYKNSEFHKVFAKRISKYLQLAESNLKFRKILFNVIKTSENGHGYKLAYAVLRLELLYKLEQIDLADTKGLEEFLINGVWPVEIIHCLTQNKIESIQRQKIKAEQDKLKRELNSEEIEKIHKNIDEMEIYLGYLMFIQKILQIPIDVEGMNRFKHTSLTDQELRSMSTYIRSKQTNYEESCSFLITQKRWKQAIQSKFPIETASTEVTKVALNEDSLENTEVPAEHDQFLIELTKRIRDENLATLISTESIQHLFESFFAYPTIKRRKFPNLTFDPENEKLLSMWLLSLVTTASHKSTGGVQAEFAKKIFKYIQLAENNVSFRKIFFEFIEISENLYGYKLTHAILKLELAYKLEHGALNTTKELEDFLIKIVWPVEIVYDLVEIKIKFIQGEKIRAEESRLKRELTDKEIEKVKDSINEADIYVRYLLFLQDGLQIYLGVEEIGHFTENYLTDQELKAAASSIVSQQADYEKSCRFLITQKKWKKVLKSKPEFFERISASKTSNEDKHTASQSYAELEEMTESHNQLLITLTKLIRSENTIISISKNLESMDIKGDY